MPRGSHLTEHERGQILAYRNAGLSFREISKKVKRCKSAIGAYLANPDAYGTKKRSGRPSILTARAKRRLILAAEKGNQSSKQLKVSQALDLSVRRIQQILSSSPNLRYEKKKQGHF
jgi:IS30 family transposase